MPWTWTLTDDESGLNIYDHTESDDAVLTLSVSAARGVVARNGTPIDPDVRAAIARYLRERRQHDPDYVADAILDLALYDVREQSADDRVRPSHAQAHGPPDDTLAAEQDRAYRKAKAARRRATQAPAHERDSGQKQGQGQTQKQESGSSDTPGGA